MTVFSLLLVASGLALAVGATGPEALSTDRASLQGAWTLVSIEANHQVAPMEQIKIGNLVEVAKLYIEGNRCTFKLGDVTLRLRLALDSTKTPKNIEMTVTEGPCEGGPFTAST